MNPDIIIDMWNADAPIDTLDLGRQAREIPVLHAKYVHMWHNSKVAAINAKSKLRELRAQKRNFLTNPTKKHLDMGWIYPDRKILKTDYSDYLDSDPEIIAADLAMANAEAVQDLLSEIIRQINNRNWVIKSVIEDRSFMHGEN